MKFSLNSTLSPKVVIHNDSSIDGTGTFAHCGISKHEIVFVKGGYILMRSQMYFEEKIDSYWPISDEFVLAAKEKKDVERIKLYINHSCEPNCGIRGDIVGIAMRDINVGEEITFDYALLDNEDNRFKCKCGNKNCRHIITGYDWEIKELQEKYKNYFVAYLKEKIENGFFYQVTSDINSEIKTLRKDVFVDELSFKDEDEFDSNESQYLHCCLYEKNEIIAYARVEIKDNNARIGRVVVRKDKRENGYGSHIMFWAETEVLKHNKCDVEVHALKSAVWFYEKLGYTAVGEEFMEENKPHLLMVKHLDLE